MIPAISPWSLKTSPFLNIIKNMMNPESKIEAILFYKAEPVKIKELAKIIATDELSIKNHISNLEKSLAGRGLCIIYNNDSVMLATSPLVKGLVEKLLKEDLEKDLGKAGLETLSIVLYMGPIKRSEIDYIRGVNSTFILRNLLIRDLVERIENPEDQRSFLYRPTFNLLSHLGVSRIDDLPEYAKTRQEIELFKNNTPKNNEKEAVLVDEIKKEETIN